MGRTNETIALLLVVGKNRVLQTLQLANGEHHQVTSARMALNFCKCSEVQHEPVPKFTAIMMDIWIGSSTRRRRPRIGGPINADQNAI